MVEGAHCCDRIMGVEPTEVINGAALLALEMFPEKMVDLIYRLLPLMARN